MKIYQGKEEKNVANLNLLPIEMELQKARNEVGYTQEEVVELMAVLLKGDSISLSLYQKWEQGTRPVKIKYAVVLARILNSSLKRLFVPESDDLMIGEVKYVPKKKPESEG